MKKNIFQKEAKKAFLIELKEMEAFARSKHFNVDELCRKIKNCKGKIFLTGVGKSGHIANKISATLSSTGTASIFIHPTEAAHGDMGLINKKDIVLLISNSGETDEIINILPSLKRHAKKVASITGNKTSSISKRTDISIVIKSGKEACPLDLAPTSSTTNTLALGDALAIALLEAKGFSKKDFAYSHPAGKLGKKLITRVEDLMHTGKSVPKVSQSMILDKALIEMTKKSLGITLVLNKNKVVGIFTDGDLRRCINKKVDIQSTKISDVMTKKFKTIDASDLAVNAAEIMEKNKIFTLVVLKKKSYAGVITMHDLIQARIL